MMGAIDMNSWALASAYLLLAIPLGVMLWLRIPIMGQTIVAVVRMTVQLLLVGIYLEVVFRLNWAWLNLLWLLVMVTVADVSILRSCGLSLRRLAGPVFFSLVVGTLLPLGVFLLGVLHGINPLDARYLIPLAGMILGNCLRADIVGIRTFHDAIRKGQRHYLQRLAAGATRMEALHPYLREACRAALAPTLATMSTIGLVALPGMMTGIVLGGTNPNVAIKYQIAIMLAIFSSTALTVTAAILLTIRSSFRPNGLQDPRIFTGKR